MIPNIGCASGLTPTLRNQTPKMLLIGEEGVGKSTIMNLFPGETILELDDDLNEIIQKPIP